MDDAAVVDREKDVPRGAVLHLEVEKSVSRALGTITPSQAGLRLLQRTPFASTRVAEQSAARTARLAIAGVRQE